MDLARAVSPKSDSDEFDSLDLEEVGEKSLWILRGEGKEQSLRSLRVSRSLRAKELEALRRENEDLKKQAGSREEKGAELRQREKQIASLTQQLEVCQPQKPHKSEHKSFFSVVGCVSDVYTLFSAILIKRGESVVPFFFFFFC